MKFGILNYLFILVLEMQNIASIMITLEENFTKHFSGQKALPLGCSNFLTVLPGHQLHDWKFIRGCSAYL